jgi:hypothetical protein
MSIDRGVWSVAGTTTLDREWYLSPNKNKDNGKKVCVISPPSPHFLENYFAEVKIKNDQNHF